jgi:hypothetical protein
MNAGLFAAQLNDVEKLLKDLDLLKKRVSSPLYQKVTVIDFKRLSYLEVWKKCYGEEFYDFCLYDDSLFQFRAISFKPLNVHYSYYECPFLPHLSLDEFIKQQQLVDQNADEYQLLRDYEFIIPIKKETVTPIRYDFDTSMYKEGLHPASHIHLGFLNEMRIGTKNILRPLSFILFILRQYYPAKWQEFVRSKNAGELCRNISQNLDDVHGKYWGKLDKWEMRLV